MLYQTHCLVFSPHSLKLIRRLPAFEEFADLVVVSDLKEKELFFGLGCLEEDSQAEPGSALKKICTQLSNAGALMDVGKSTAW